MRGRGRRRREGSGGEEERRGRQAGREVWLVYTHGVIITDHMNACTVPLTETWHAVEVNVKVDSQLLPT